MISNSVNEDGGIVNSFCNILKEKGFPLDPYLFLRIYGSHIFSTTDEFVRRSALNDLFRIFLARMPFDTLQVRCSLLDDCSIMDSIRLFRDDVAPVFIKGYILHMYAGDKNVKGNNAG